MTMAVRTVGTHESGCNCIACKFASTIVEYLQEADDNQEELYRVGDILQLLNHYTAQFETQILRAGCSQEAINELREEAREAGSRNLLSALYQSQPSS
jgi:hypothetical protein